MCLVEKVGLAGQRIRFHKAFFLPYKIKKNYKADFQFSMAAIAGKDMMSASPNYDSHLQ